MSTYHIIDRFTNPLQNSERVNFAIGLHPVPGIDNKYTQRYVNDTMDVQIGRTNRQRYFTSDSSLDKGHMAARADFPFAAQQKATFYYLNCFPQFHRFNSINWLALERSIREHDFQADVEVFTSVHGVLYLRNESNDWTAVHLMNGNNFPIPSYVQKDIRVTINNKQYDYSFVGFNHPNIQSPEFNYLLNGYHDACDEKRYNWLLRSLRKIGNQNNENRINPLRGILLCL